MESHQKTVFSFSRFIDRLMLPADNLKSAITIIATALIYIIISLILPIFFKQFIIVGILTQIQMVLSVFLTLRYIHAGYLTALALNGLSIVQSLQRLDDNPNVENDLGVIFYIDIILLLTIVAFFATRSHRNFQQLLKQKKEVSQAYYQATVSEEALWKKNKELETSNKIINRDKEDMYRLAYIDPLTNLPNRRMFRKQMGDLVDGTKDQIVSFSLVFMDLDDFKKINDTLGHQAGDELIRYFGFSLGRLTGSEDMIFHTGGDEFALVIRRSLSRDEVKTYLNRLAAELRNPVHLGDAQMGISTSFGVAMYPQDTVKSAEIIRYADTAMYESKRAGKDRINFFKPSMLEHIIRETKLEQGLKTAIVNQEISLVFQPQYFVGSGGLRGFETLIRWQSPQHGYVSPITFIPIAEKSGMIVTIGEWVLRTACTAFKKLQKSCEFSGKLAVNVSAVQMMERSFIPRFRKVLEETEFSPRNLEIEITETSLVHSIEQVRFIVNELQKIGITVALDDFGTGFSSLSYLQKLPFDLVKIDKSFIDNINRDLKSNQFVTTIITMVHQMNIPVLAEGVETESQKKFLLEKNCDMIQGYLYGKPMPIDEIKALLDLKEEHTD
ncbi:putative bifunctional diguanylate cyclase/phosphodiesterase [Sporolactobacillus putidus]|uniref:Diguanylate cyclase (GGDEF) domain-containing protein n=1 Tax=Sporolactobacillus putidus TaxID=492735 RepID=A0A917S699_9BACL|nr:GGDEF domain-containing phosphodiesterase [Sporolactobacillus putidus]GGL59658.1 hypothetical protein GCM10007968_24530 [Sporolactobacillus putidus]